MIGKKILRILSYLQGTMHFYLTISCKDLHTMSWFIDGSYAVHADMKGHSGAVLMIGGNVILSHSNKQKVNTRSSTETELIAIDDALPTVQWAINFLQDQNITTSTLIKEDNRSTLLLMKNGQLSAGKRSKNLDIRYFYVQDLINQTVRDFFSPGNFYAYVAWYKKVDKKIETLKFAVGYIELCSQSVQLLTQ
jgi:hypothetical protein